MHATWMEHAVDRAGSFLSAWMVDVPNVSSSCKQARCMFNLSVAATVLNKY